MTYLRICQISLIWALGTVVWVRLSGGPFSGREMFLATLLILNQLWEALLAQYDEWMERRSPQ